MSASAWNGETTSPRPPAGTGLGRLWSRGERPDRNQVLEASGIRRRPGDETGLLSLRPMTPRAAAWRERHRKRRERQVPPGRATRALRCKRDRRGLLPLASMALVLGLAITGIGSLVSRPAQRILGRGEVVVRSCSGEVQCATRLQEGPLHEGQILRPGSSLRCEATGRVELRPALAGVVLRLFGDTVATLHELRHDETSGQLLLRVEVLRGRAEFEILEARGRAIARVQTPHGSEVWTQRARFQVQVSEGASVFAVSDGAIAAVAGAERVVVPSDHCLRSTFAQPLSEPRRVNVTCLAWRTR